MGILHLWKAAFLMTLEASHLLTQLIGMTPDCCLSAMFQKAGLQACEQSELYIRGWRHTQFGNLSCHHVQ